MTLYLNLGEFYFWFFLSSDKRNMLNNSFNLGVSVNFLLSFSFPNFAQVCRGYWGIRAGFDGFPLLMINVCSPGALLAVYPKILRKGNAGGRPPLGGRSHSFCLEYKG